MMLNDDLIPGSPSDESTMVDMPWIINPVMSFEMGTLLDYLRRVQVPSSKEELRSSPLRRVPVNLSEKS
jgi:hypothetical protein